MMMKGGTSIKNAAVNKMMVMRVMMPMDCDVSMHLRYLSQKGSMQKSVFREKIVVQQQQQT